MNPTDNTAAAHADAGPSERVAQRRASRMAGSLRGRALEAIVAAGPDGFTALELTYALGYGLEKLYSVAPRLSELEREGYVVKGAVRDDRVSYVATAAGRAWASSERAA